MRYRLILPALLYLSACSQDLPEPESQAAQLYVKTCSGKGCHAPIPPQRGGRGYWDLQLERMFELMRQQGRPLPNPQQQQLIRDYLQRHAQSSKR